MRDAAGLVPAALEAMGAVRDVIDTCRTAATLDRDSLGAYVVSMAADVSDILAVELLQRDAGDELENEPGEAVSLFQAEERRDVRMAQ